MRCRDAWRRFLPGAGDAERALPDARGRQHRAADGRGLGADARGQDQARALRGRGGGVTSLGGKALAEGAAGWGRVARRFATATDMLPHGLHPKATKKPAPPQRPGVGVVMMTGRLANLDGRGRGRDAREVCLHEPFGPHRLTAAVQDPMARPRY